MKRHLGIFILLAGLVAVEPAWAQRMNNPARSYGVGVGYYNGPRGIGNAAGPAVGIYPLYYPGFYGNGMSMYGPPVPTYGPLPGTFGGSDYRVTQNAPFFGTSLGWFGSRSPSPRPVPNFNYNPPAFPGSGAENIIPAAPMEATCLVLEVRAPIENAVVFVNDTPTKSTGATRVYSSPPLQADENYLYNVRVEWIVDGRKQTMTKIVAGKAGDRVLADFTQ
jgi:uncharacterized protein (TIGR03000 family)